MARRKDLHRSPVTLLLSLRLPPLLLMALDSQVIKSLAPLPGCVIEKNVKYSGNNLSSKYGINQETCALLCFKKPSCTHWTHNPTYQFGKCWMKTSSSGRTKSTTGSTSGQKACGSRGFSLPEVTKAAATAVAECQSPWTSLVNPLAAICSMASSLHGTTQKGNVDRVVGIWSRLALRKNKKLSFGN